MSTNKKSKKTELAPIKCEICGKIFTPKDKRRRTCSRSCGGKLGNTEAAREKARQTRLKKYGDANYNNRDKARRTVQKKYGEEYINTSQVPEIKKKIIETYTERHGGMGMASDSVAEKVVQAAKKKYNVEDDSITSVGQIEAIKDKIRETTVSKWGGIGFASEELAERSMKTYEESYGEDLYKGDHRKNLARQGLIDKYGVASPMCVPEFKEKALNTTIKKHGGLGGNVKSIQQKYKNNLNKFNELYETDKYTLIEIADLMGVSYPTVVKWAKELGIEFPVSNKLNETWHLFLKKETGIDFEFEGAIYDDNYKKVDLYNNEFKVAIEINPTITHTTQPSPFHNKKVPIKYHQERAIMAEENGWHLIQVFDWDKPEDIVNLVKSLFDIDQTKIFARKCELKEIEISQARNFVEKNHRQGARAIGNIAYGLFYNNELVQVMSFAKERFVKDNGEKSYELIRMCSKEGTKVVGGASKLFKAFINSNYKPMKIKTFADYSKGQGKIYEKMGMKYVGLANLNGLYANIDTGEAYKVTTVTQKFRKEYEKLGQTQQQYMNSKRFYRINDAGNKIFEWNRE